MNRLEIEMHRRQNTHCKERKILLHRISNRLEKSRKHQAVKGEKREEDGKEASLSLCSFLQARCRCKQGEGANKGQVQTRCRCKQGEGANKVKVQTRSR